jgi:hypothetical protein
MPTFSKMRMSHCRSRSGSQSVLARRGLDLAVDDRKPRRILRERFSEVRTWWTVDLLRADRVISALGRAEAEDCFAKAVRFGRMHVPRH